jgi:hypothetical protein
METEMNLSKQTLTILCLIWAFGILLGVSASFNLPFLLLIAASILLLLS